MSNTFEVKGEGKSQVFDIGFEGEDRMGETIHTVVSHSPDIPVQEAHYEGAVKLMRLRLAKVHPQLVNLQNVRPAPVNSVGSKLTLKN